MAANEPQPAAGSMANIAFLGGASLARLMQAFEQSVEKNTEALKKAAEPHPNAFPRFDTGVSETARRQSAADLRTRNFDAYSAAEQRRQEAARGQVSYAGGVPSG